MQASFFSSVKDNSYSFSLIAMSCNSGLLSLAKESPGDFFENFNSGLSGSTDLHEISRLGISVMP